MTKEDRDRAEARLNKITRAAQDTKTGKTERDASARAVLDNMARLKALRLAREATEPPRAPAASKKARAKPAKPGEKSPTLAAWLETQQSSGRRT
jgi:hypothetical protein